MTVCVRYSIERKMKKHEPCPRRIYNLGINELPRKSRYRGLKSEPKGTPVLKTGRGRNACKGNFKVIVRGVKRQKGDDIMENKGIGKNYKEEKVNHIKGCMKIN